MKKYVVVSSNNNPDYLFYAPYMEKAWNHLGWELCVIITHDVNPADLNLKNPDTIIVQLPNIPGLRQETIAQAGRLYAANYLNRDALYMTSDMDLLPLQGYWKPDPNNITVYGHDLTWHSYYPMGYIAMTGHNWAKYMNCTMNTASDMERDCKETQIAYSEKWEDWWNVDWNLITLRLSPFKDKITFIERGQVQIANATLAKGRIDRYNWKATQEGNTEFIDAHCHNNNVFHPDKMNDFLKVFEFYYGKL